MPFQANVARGKIGKRGDTKDQYGLVIFKLHATRKFKQIIYKAYIGIFSLIQKFLDDNSISICLTTDM